MDSVKALEQLEKKLLDLKAEGMIIPDVVFECVKEHKDSAQAEIDASYEEVERRQDQALRWGEEKTEQE